MQVMIISGQARSGKSYLASLIAEEVFKNGYIPVIDNFASPIKEEAASVGLEFIRRQKDWLRFLEMRQLI